MLRLPPHNTQHVTFMHPFQCDPQTQLQETHRTTHTGSTIVAKHIEGTKRPQPQPPHTRGTFHRRLQPLYTEKHKVSCSGFLPTTKPMQHSCSHSNAICNHNFKKCIELPFVTTPLLHHFPSSPLPFVTQFHRFIVLHQGQFHRFFFVCYVLLCYVVMYCYVLYQLLCYVVMLCSYVLLCALPPFIKVNSTASYSCVMYCCVMYCYVIYHPSSRSIPPLLILLLCIVMLCIVL